MNDPRKRMLARVLRVLQVGVLAGICVVFWLYKTAPAPAPAASVAPTDAEVAPPPEPAADPTPAPRAVSAIQEKWGIQVDGIGLTNDATTVQVRYTVVAPDKTALLAGTDSSPYLVDQATGQKLPAIVRPPAEAVPVGAHTRTIGRMMRQAGQFPPSASRLIAGKTYALQVPNWGRTLQPGSKVSLVVGDLRQDDLVVQ